MHFRKDSAAGITAPNLDSNVDIIGHITKHRGQKTPFTSVSEKVECVKHFDGELYCTEPDTIVADGHDFRRHATVLEQIRSAIQTGRRAEKVLAQRAFQDAERAREAIIGWRFNIDRIDRKDRISWCYANIQRYFRRA